MHLMRLFVLKNNFEDLFLNSRNRLFGYVYKLTSNRTDTEDIVQETYYRYYKKYKESDSIPEGHFLQLKCIAKNIVIDLYRKKSTRKESIFSDINYPEQIISDNSEDSLTIVHKKMLYEKIRGALECLNPITKEIVYLTYYKNFTVDQISALFNLGNNVIDYILKQGNVIMRDHLEKLLLHKRLSLN